MTPYVYNATVIRVIDGDSIEVDIDLGFHVVLSKQNIRLKNVDAPESRTSDPIEKQFGLLAKEVVSSYLPLGTKILLHTDLSDSDKFGRILGIVEVITKADSFILNEYLVENHYAVPYEGQNKSEIKEAHLANRVILLAEEKILL